LRDGDPLELRRQPANPHDPNAIAVFRGALQLGYLRREIARHLAPKLDGGERYRARVASVTGGGSKAVGVNIRCERVTLPAARRPAQSGAAAGRAAVLEALIGTRPLRESQTGILERVFSGRNTLAILGTGRGKSLCFALPAAALAFEERKKTLVLYPLRALANDQFEAMRRRLEPLGLRILRANGSIDDEERAALSEALDGGAWDVMLATPEFVQFHRARFARPHNRPALVVVDECHHLFESKHRQAYVSLSSLLAELGSPQLLGLTATAGNAAFAHLRAVLGIDAWVIDPTVRANLSVVDARGTREKREYLARILDGGEGKAIVYCNSRSEATKVAEALRVRYRETAFYHAGLGPPERTAVEQLFREGSVRIVVATSAFGEGIDLPDVRDVVLYHLNFSFTEFNQQAGRAGRDGEPARIHLLYGPPDRRINDHIIAKSAPSVALLRELYRGLKGCASEGVVRTSYAELARVLELDMADAQTIATAVRIFCEAGLCESGSDDEGRYVRFLPVSEKVDLTATPRYLEGQAERDSFERFCTIALEAEAETLGAVISRPIYPEHVPLIR
jgi:single-stranded-DNA-specific exonuclease